MSERYADQRGHDVAWMTAAERAASDLRAQEPAYGWCAYCPNFTYNDLNRGPDGKQPGACGDCVERWQEFPDTCPPRRKESR